MLWWLLGAGAGAGGGKRHRANRKGKALALAAAIRELVITTDPLIVKLVLRCGGDFFSALQVACVVKCDCDRATVTVLEGLVSLRRIDDHVLAKGCGGCGHRERSEYDNEPLLGRQKSEKGLEGLADGLGHGREPRRSRAGHQEPTARLPPAVLGQPHQLVTLKFQHRCKYR